MKSTDTISFHQKFQNLWPKQNETSTINNDKEALTIPYIRKEDICTVNQEKITHRANIGSKKVNQQWVIFHIVKMLDLDMS